MADHRAARPTAAPVGGEQGRPDHVRTPGALAPDAGGRPVIPAWHVVPWRRPRVPPQPPPLQGAWCCSGKPRDSPHATRPARNVGPAPSRGP